MPNSLGPAELLLHYGTDEQKYHYLPRLADGREIPCFALTGPTAGSDATSMPDYGIVCEGDWNGARVLGVQADFRQALHHAGAGGDVIGLAFRLYDPDGLLGDASDRGITLALMPRDTAGLDIGRRHFPLNCAFQNGPVRGKDVFVPLSQLIGGEDFIGQGWRMLVECLSVGRAITLPSTSSGASQAGGGGHRRLRAHPQAVRPVHRPLRGRGGSAGAHRRQHLCDAPRCRRRPRPRWTAARSRRCLRRSPSTTPPRWRAKWPRTPWTSTAARA